MNAFNIFAAVCFVLMVVRIAMIAYRTVRLHQLNNKVAETYNTLLSNPDRQVLYDYWASLEQTCRPGKLCIECEREMLMQGEP